MNKRKELYLLGFYIGLVVIFGGGIDSLEFTLNLLIALAFISICYVPYYLGGNKCVLEVIERTYKSGHNLFSVYPPIIRFFAYICIPACLVHVIILLIQNFLVLKNSLS
jgi:hypothetical protein